MNENFGLSSVRIEKYSKNFIEHENNCWNYGRKGSLYCGDVELYLFFSDDEYFKINHVYPLDITFENKIINFMKVNEPNVENQTVAKFIEKVCKFQELLEYSMNLLDNKRLKNELSSLSVFIYETELGMLTSRFPVKIPFKMNKRLNNKKRSILESLADIDLHEKTAGRISKELGPKYKVKNIYTVNYLEKHKGFFVNKINRGA